MAQLNIECSVFDPVRITTGTQASSFIIDTWFSHALITQDLFTRLPGLPTMGTGSVQMSSGMSMTRPRVEIGVQIRNIRALPIQAYVVDHGPAPLLLGSDFMRLMFEIGAPFEPGRPYAGVEPPSKRERASLALRLISGEQQPELVDVENFLSAVRRIHNCALVAESGRHQHGDWPNNRRDEAMAEAIRATIRDERHLSDEESLHVTWVESGSIWVTLKSGAVSGLTWLSQLFRLSMDARLQRTMAEAATAEEQARVAEMTRDEIIHARRAEENLRTTRAVRQTRDEWRKEVLDDIDFRRALADRMENPVAREAVQSELDQAIGALAESKLVGMIEHVPDVSSEYPRLPRRTESRREGRGRSERDKE